MSGSDFIATWSMAHPVLAFVLALPLVLLATLILAGLFEVDVTFWRRRP
jgi:hypothetical protein